jgi:hypothetical protein
MIYDTIRRPQLPGKPRTAGRLDPMKVKLTPVDHNQDHKKVRVYADESYCESDSAFLTEG